MSYGPIDCIFLWLPINCNCSDIAVHVDEEFRGFVGQGVARHEHPLLTELKKIGKWLRLNQGNATSNISEFTERPYVYIILKKASLKAVHSSEKEGASLPRHKM
jgi:hypothetical protein